MKTKITLLALFISLISFAQNGINYKAVIKDNLGNVVANNPNITIQFEILKGAAQTSVYRELHTTSTDANGITIVNIGEGALLTGSAAFNTVVWGSDDHFLNVKVNIGGGLIDMGTTEFKTVPYAISSSDNQWNVNGNKISNKNVGNVGIGVNNPGAKLDINGDLRLQFGTSINEFSTDVNLTGNSSSAAPTERAVKTYVNNNTFWSPTGSNIRNSNTGNVSIGETNPTAKLHISKGYGGTPFLELESQSGDRANLRFSKNGANDFWDQIAGIRTNAASGTLSYYYSNNHIMTLRGDGKVGINNFDPQAALDVVGDIKTSGELHRPSTGSANMIPIAYGMVNTDGSILNGTNNFGIVKRTAPGLGTVRYDITIIDENINYNTNVVILSIAEGSGTISYKLEEGVIFVWARPDGQNARSARFSFVVHKP